MSWIRHFLGSTSRPAYHARRYRFLGIPTDTLALWACFVALLAVGWAWLTRSVAWGHVLLGAAAIMTITTILFQRARKYTLFGQGADIVVGNPTDPLEPEELVRLRASGMLEVEGKRQLLMDVPAVFWITELGDYILMAQVMVRDLPLLEGPVDDEGMWYAFINPSQIVGIQQGTLCFGKARPVLRLIYSTSDEGRTLYFECATPQSRQRLARDIISRTPQLDL